MIPHIRKAKTIAIDLEVTDDVESDKKSILEFGWKNAAGTGRCKNSKGLNFSELSEAAEECLSGQTAPCIVGHNLLDWDWPILQQHEVAFPESSSLWDTLIASWLLKPWCDSHALVVHEGAHQADADAEACYVLFETQSTQLAPCLEGSDYDIRSLVDRLFADPALLTTVEGRDYPSNLSVSLDTATVYPSCRKHEITWQRGCRLEMIAAENRLEDPVLFSEQCRQVADEQNDIKAKVVHIVVADAAKQEGFVAA